MSNHPWGSWDLSATLADFADTPAPPTNGLSMQNLLRGDGPVTQHEYFYWEFNNRWGGHYVQAIRQEDWKFLRFVEPERTWIELHNLRTDIGEFNNLAAHYLEITMRLSNLIDKVRVDL